MSGRMLLGIDGGGTSTVAWLADAGGDLLGQGQAGPSNIKAVGAVAAREALDRAIAAAFAAAGRPARPVEAACLGLAGFDRPDDREVLGRWSAEAGWTRRLVLANDGDLVIAAGSPQGWGLGVIAGTGSIAVGRAADGRTARAGGWGPLLGDEGSGYAVALAALRMVARCADGREPRSPSSEALTVRLCEAMAIDGPSRLVATVYSAEWDRTRIASLARVVVAAADDDSEIARVLLEPAGADLAAAVLAVARALDWSGGPMALGMAGGFLLSAAAVSRSLLDHLARGGLVVEPAAVPQPALGAVLLARRALDAERQA